MDFPNDDVLRGVFITYLTIYDFSLQGSGSGSKCRLLPHATETKSWKLAIGIRQWCYQGRISTLRCSMRWDKGAGSIVSTTREEVSSLTWHNGCCSSNVLLFN